MEETVSIPKKEYIKLKKNSEIDKEFLEEIAKSLEDIKKGRVKRIC